MYNFPNEIAVNNAGLYQLIEQNTRTSAVGQTNQIEPYPRIKTPVKPINPEVLPRRFVRRKGDRRKKDISVLLDTRTVHEGRNMVRRRSDRLDATMNKQQAANDVTDKSIKLPTRGIDVLA
jgi:hypothetical protein